ncbi:uncharacterized protein LOC129584142 [Paramacrobiotus metropolitanus]|uniref:uncharacterized protein LOC129584142 n=1 Tax=Paramacrobiotus metropolitanus TaxID=2943436 RepID=UPI0024457448|nr:uncharacterized protein LOC129584142 [Paramacrobiotus metropolitanus]
MDIPPSSQYPARSSASHILLEEIEHEAENEETRERDVHFFLPSTNPQSRRSSADDAAQMNSRPRSSAFSNNPGSSSSPNGRMLLVHTFPLSAQSGPSQTLLLPRTNVTGNRVLAACRDDSMRCAYFHEEDVGGDELVVVPKSALISSFPLEKPWKVGAMSVKTADPSVPGCVDLVVCLAYLPRQKDGAAFVDSDKAPKSILIAAWMQPEDLAMEKPVLAHVHLGFTPHGCNQLIWWKDLEKLEETTARIIIPSQEDALYCLELPRTLPQTDNMPLHVQDASSVVPLFSKIGPLSCVNAMEYFDQSDKRYIAVSTGPSASIRFGYYSVASEEWYPMWEVRHDSMTSRMRFFQDGNKVHLLVIGLLEVAIIYLNVSAELRPKSVVLPKSKHFDVVTSCDIVSGNGGSRPEIFLGTYGRSVLVYQFDEVNPVLSYVLETACPVYYLAVADMLRSMQTSAQKELVTVVVTQKAIQVYCLV